jgi:hypothetical protein
MPTWVVVRYGRETAKAVPARQLLCRTWAVDVCSVRRWRVSRAKRCYRVRVVHERQLLPARVFSRAALQSWNVLERVEPCRRTELHSMPAWFSVRNGLNRTD